MRAIPVVSALALASISNGWSQSSVYDKYGRPREAELSTIVLNGEAYQRRAVRTRGRLDIGTNGYYVLSETGAQVLALPVREMVDVLDSARTYSRVVVQGVVRAIRRKEYVGGVDLDLVEDPDLPPLPAPNINLPRFSLTIFALSDDSETSPSRELPQGDVSKGQIHLVGQFRGKNLFGDLPTHSQRSPEDWVLLAGTKAFWVIGKKPKGSGWELDPNLKADTRHWLEVSGRLETSDGVAYIFAKKVSLSHTPNADSSP